MGRAARIRQERAARQGGPPSADAFNRALEALQSGNEGAGIVLLRQAIIDNPAHRKAHFRLAMVLREQGNLQDAIGHYEKAIALDPRDIDGLVNLGEALRRRGRLQEAIATCDQAVSIGPRHAEAYLIRGVARHDVGDLVGATADLERAITENPAVAHAYTLLAKILGAAGRQEEALALLRKTSLVWPNDAKIFRGIGDLCGPMGRIADAFSAYRRAIEIEPYDTSTYTNLSALLCNTKLLDVVLSITDVGIKLAPNTHGLHYNRGIALEKLDRLDEALQSYRNALRCAPDCGRSLTSICRLRAQICDWDGLATSTALARTLTLTTGAPSAPFAILSTNASLTEILDCNKIWSQSIVARKPPLASYAPRPPHRRHEPLRIGYLSADFHTHATSALIVELFELHDKTRFETWGYSIGAHDEGPMRQRVAKALDHFHDITDLAYDDAAARIRADEIDILIDLKGYTFQARPEILVRRPAPIQINFLGYPSTMGAHFIDYIIGDPIVTPTEHAPYYSEKIIQLPHSYQPNDRKRIVAPAMPSRADCGLPEDGFVFCCFNANYKITPTLFELWMRLLHEVPNSVLWLYQANALASGNLKREAAARQIDPARLVFAPKVSVPDHLARMQLGDLFLDTSPYGAHTTASEALWVGLPVLTYLGEAFASRVGASLVTAVGLPELVASTYGDYEAIARHLARTPQDYRALRSKLKANLSTAPLFDSVRYTRAFEDALTRVAEIRNAGEAPGTVSIRYL